MYLNEILADPACAILSIVVAIAFIILAYQSVNFYRNQKLDKDK